MNVYIHRFVIIFSTFHLPTFLSFHLSTFSPFHLFTFHLSTFQPSTFQSFQLSTFLPLYLPPFHLFPFPPSTLLQQRLLANYIPGDTHSLQRSTGYQFSSDRYYILSYCQQYISRYDLNHLSKMTQKEFKVTLRMIALFEYCSE